MGFQEAPIDKLTPDTKLQLFQLLDLEACLPLSQTCKTLFSFWRAVDSSLVRTKVVERVPWFVLNEGETGLRSWDLCARVLVSRTANCLKDGTIWLPINDIRGAINTRCKEEICTPLDISNGKRLERLASMYFPIFSGQEIWDTEDKGPTLRGSWLGKGQVEVDLFTSETRSRAKETPKHEETFPEVFLIDCDTPTDIRITSENNKLLLLLINNDFQCLVHKDMCLRDKQGNYLVDEKQLTAIKPQKWYGKTVITLLPGDMGAMMVKSLEDEPVKYCDPYGSEDRSTGIYNHSSGYFRTRYTTSDTNIDGRLKFRNKSYLAYIEPTPELRHVILFFLPICRPGQENSSSFIFYNGYLYYHYDTVVVQLWVDLGFQRVVDLQEDWQILGHHELAQTDDTQALTAFNFAKPAMRIGSMAHSKSHKKIVQAKNGLERYVTIQPTRGSVVIDLLTRSTFSVDDSTDSLCFPIVSKSWLGFVSVDSGVAHSLATELENLEMLDEEDRYLNLHDLIDMPEENHEQPEALTSRSASYHVHRFNPNFPFILNQHIFSSTKEIQRKIRENPSRRREAYDMDALLANAYTYAVQYPIKNNPPGLEELNGYNSGDEDIYDIRMERSRRRDYAFSTGTDYKGWHLPDDEYDECGEEDCESYDSDDIDQMDFWQTDFRPNFSNN